MVAMYVSLAIFTTAATTLAGSDDLLAAFACGAAFAWDDWFSESIGGLERYNVDKPSPHSFHLTDISMLLNGTSLTLRGLQLFKHPRPARQLRRFRVHRRDHTFQRLQ